MLFFVQSIRDESDFSLVEEIYKNYNNTVNAGIFLTQNAGRK